MRVFRRIGVIALATVFAAGSWAGGPPKADKKEIKKMATGVVYARIDIPCEQGRHAFGVYQAPVVTVTPDGANTADGMGMDASWWHAQSTFWGVAPNDPLEITDADFDGAAMEIELEGIKKSKGNDTVIRFEKITSLDDFKKAFDHAFSRTPLQDEDPDWPERIRAAISDRRLVDGMSKRQAFYVVGAPERFETTQEGDSKVEVWFTRQDRGMQVGYWTSKSEGTGYPSQLKFVDGTLTQAGPGGATGGVDLDE